MKMEFTERRERAMRKGLERRFVRVPVADTERSAVPKPKGMSITERLYYLRERGYGIKTVGCIEQSNLIGLLSKERIGEVEFVEGSRELTLTIASMVAGKLEDKRYDAKER